MGKYDAEKTEVLEVSRRLSREGYFGARGGTSGNVSVLVPGEDAIAVTPSGLGYETMTPDDICVVGFDLAPLEGEHKPSVETPMHIAVYRNREDVSAVIHTHQPHASVFSVLHMPIPVLFDELAVAIGPSVAVAPYGLSGTQDLLDAVVSVLGNRCHCYIMRNHGALCVGPDLTRAHYFVELLEKAAMVYHNALATGRPVHTLPGELAEKLHKDVMAAQDEAAAARRAAYGA